MLKPEYLKAKILQNKILNKLIFLKSVDSTNEFLKNGKFLNGTIAIAETQTGGKGKFGKKWISEKGGLWFSFILNKKIKNPYLFVILSSVAIMEVLKKYKVNAKIKWPNDILINGKKICGILIENDFLNEKVITGIGININNKPPANTDIPSTSLKEIKNKKEDPNEFLLKLIKKLEYYLLNEKRKKQLILKKWLLNQVDLRNKKIKLMAKNGKINVYKVMKKNKNGNLIVLDKLNRKKIIKSDIFFI